MPIFTDTWTNIGLDLTVSVLDDSGNKVDLGGRIQDYEPKPKLTLISREGLEDAGLPDHRQTHDGWDLMFRVSRSNDNFELLVARIEANLIAIPSVQTRFTVIDNMANGGGVSSQRFQTFGCVLMTDTIGSRKKKDIVEFSFTMHGKVRQPI